VLAGLGIGGIAIAFAAQKTLENLFGGISVLADEVIRVGDYCRFGDRTGTVEDISLRSTRVRTDARTELSIPNGTLATMNIENFTRRDKILFSPVLAIRYETTADQLRYLLAEIRRMLYEHPKVESDSASIRFANFDSSALRLEISSYVLTRDSNEFIADPRRPVAAHHGYRRKFGQRFRLPVADALLLARFRPRQGKSQPPPNNRSSNGATSTAALPRFCPADKVGLSRIDCLSSDPESATGKTSGFPETKGTSYLTR
jgi:MscS family membrane protein